MTEYRFIAGVVAGLCTAGVAFGQCDVTPPTGAIPQNDPGFCGSTGQVDANGGCNDDPVSWQDIGTLAEGFTSLAGNVGAWTDDDLAEVRDLDWYSMTAPVNGVISYTFNSSNAGVDVADFVGFIVTGADDCDTAVFEGFVFPCGGFFEKTVAAGQVMGCVVTVNGFGDGNASSCLTDYVVTMEFAPSTYDCGDPAQGECTEPNGTPGCSDQACCELVCEFDAACCDGGWDEVCVTNAYDLCGYYLYECTDPNYGNDCVVDAVVDGEYQIDLVDTDPVVVSGDTTGANTDGPGEEGCGSGAGFEQLNADLWYVVSVPGAGFLSASTCDGGALWDTKIAMYNYDAATFDPAALPDLFAGCNEDCGDAAFASALQIEVSGAASYLVRIGGYDVGSGPFDMTIQYSELPTYECVPGADPVISTQSADMGAAFNGVSCAYGTGITTTNQFARKYQNVDEQTIGCTDFGVYNGGSGVLANLNVANDTTAGETPEVTTLEQIDTKEVYIVGGGYLGLTTVSFDPQLDVTSGMNVVFEADFPESPDGFVSTGCNDLGEDAPTFLKADPCGLATYTSYESIGFPGYHWAHNFTSWGGGGGGTCVGDLNGDSVVDGADLTILLGSWGTSDAVADLNEDGSVDGADLTLLLGAWGACQP
jgi:hypothetical protein